MDYTTYFEDICYNLHLINTILLFSIGCSAGGIVCYILHCFFKKFL